MINSEEYKILCYIKKHGRATYDELILIGFASDQIEAALSYTSVMNGIYSLMPSGSTAIEEYERVRKSSNNDDIQTVNSSKAIKSARIANIIALIALAGSIVAIVLSIIS